MIRSRFLAGAAFLAAGATLATLPAAPARADDFIPGVAESRADSGLTHEARATNRRNARLEAELDVQRDNTVKAIQSEVDRGLYDQAHGDALKEQVTGYVDSQRVNASNGVAADVRRIVKDNQGATSDLTTRAEQDALNLGRQGDPDAQATSVVDLAKGGLKAQEQVIRDARVIVERDAAQIDAINRARNDAIQSNPNASADVKRQAAQEYQQQHTAATTTLARQFAAAEYNNRQAQRVLDEKSDQLKQKIAERIAEYTETYGPDPKSWPTDTPAPAAKPAAPPAAAAPPPPAPEPAAIPSAPRTASRPPRDPQLGPDGLPADPYAGLRVPQEQAAAPAPAAQPRPVPAPQRGNASRAAGDAGRAGARIPGVASDVANTANAALAAAAQRPPAGGLDQIPDELLHMQPGRVGVAPTPSVGGGLLALTLIVASGLLQQDRTSSASDASGGAAGAAGAAVLGAGGGGSGAQHTTSTIAQQRTPFVQPRLPGGPGYPTAPVRTGSTRTQGLREGQFNAGDAFGGAAAAAAAGASAASLDAVDIARIRVEDENSRAMATWDRLADQVYYDENGVIRRLPTPQPENTYRPAPRPQHHEPVQDPTWRAFEAGGVLTVAELEPIYEGWDINTAPMGSSGRSLSAVGTSPRIDWNLPSVGGTSAQIAAEVASGMVIRGAADMGTNINWGGLDLAADPLRVNGHAGPVPGSYSALLSQINAPQTNPWSLPLWGASNPWSYQPLASTAHDLAQALYGPLWSDRPYAIHNDPGGAQGLFTGGAIASQLWQVGYLNDALHNGQGGLERLLAQPFNVLLTWGADAYDLDLHMTGPSGEGQTDRFHIYYSAQGSQTVFPFAELITDCICNSGSEVILTTQLARGGVYRISAFNFGDQSATSTNLSSASNAQLQIVRGGQAVSVGDGSTIVGGHIIYTGAPVAGAAGNTWLAVEIDPDTGRISAPNLITQSQDSTNVR